MDFFQPYVNMFRNYINFSGRTRRRDFWVAVLVNFVITLILSILTRILSVFGVVQTIYGLAILLPFLALWARRLHDINMSAWFLLLNLIPGIGSLILLVFACMDSQPGSNRPEPPEGRFRAYVFGWEGVIRFLPRPVRAG